MILILHRVFFYFRRISEESPEESPKSLQRVIKESSKNDLSTSLQGEVEIIKSIIGQEAIMLQSYAQLNQNIEKIQEKVNILKDAIKIVEKLEKLMPNIKNTKVIEEIEKIEKDVNDSTSKYTDMSWTNVVKTMIVKVKSVIQETLKKEEIT